MKTIRRFHIYEAKCKAFITFIDGYKLGFGSKLFSRCYFHSCSYNDGYSSCLNFDNRINSNIFKTDW